MSDKNIDKKIEELFAVVKAQKAEVEKAEKESKRSWNWIPIPEILGLIDNSWILLFANFLKTTEFLWISIIFSKFCKNKIFIGLKVCCWYLWNVQKSYIMSLRWNVGCCSLWRWACHESHLNQIWIYLTKSFPLEAKRILRFYS